MSNEEGISSSLGRLKCELSAKDYVPKATGDSEAVREVCVVVLEVVFLKLLPVGRETAIAVSLRLEPT